MTTTKPDIFSRSWQPAEAAAYFAKLTAADDGFASGVVEAMDRAGVRGRSITALEGRLVEALVRISGARKAVEIGTLYGYSAHWIARGMADGGRLYSLEKDPACVNSAKDAVEASALSRKVTVMEGPAAESLKTLVKLAPFDLCFIDADSQDYPDYLRWAAANLRPGGLVLANNVFIGGRISADDSAAEGNAGVRAMREFFHILFDSDRFVSASVLPTGEGMALGIKAQPK